MNRRAFLRLAAGGTVAISALRYLPSLPSLHTWKKTTICRFRQPIDTTSHVGYIFGLRDDNRLFVTTMVIPDDQFSPEAIDRYIENALNSLNQCLTQEKFDDG